MQNYVVVLQKMLVYIQNVHSPYGPIRAHVGPIRAQAANSHTPFIPHIDYLAKVRPSENKKATAEPQVAPGGSEARDNEEDPHIDDRENC